MFFQEVFTSAALSDRIEIQTKSSDRGAFGPTNVVWSTIETRWGALVSAPMGIGPTRQNKTYDDHRRKKKSGSFLVFRTPFTALDNVGYGDHVRFRNKRTGVFYTLDQVDWDPGAYPSHFISIPVIVTPEEKDNEESSS